jgi:hypothetical protein
VGPRLAWVDRFPLFDMVRACSRHVVEDGMQGIYYASTNPDIQIKMVAHFSLGIFWRAAVHSWKKTKSQPMISLGTYTDPIRLWLRGSGPFPNDMVLHLTVARPELAQIVHSLPVEVLDHKRGPFRVYWLHLLGALFTLLVGPGLPDIERDLCFYQSPLHPVLVDDSVASAIKKKYLREYMEARQTKAYQKYKDKRSAKKLES